MGDELTMRPEDAHDAAVAAAAVAAPCADLFSDDGSPSPERGRVLHGTGGIFQQLGDESRLAAGLPVYRKVKLLGRGAFGKAYLVEGMRGGVRGGAPTSPTRSSQRIRRVLKKLPLKGISEDQREAAFREALLMRRISRGCPFITQFSEVFLGKGGTILCIVMEFCSGGDLRTLVRGREGARFPEENILGWGAQVGLALRHCHVHGVLHRDVKPENCFFRVVGGDLLLADFGISCALDEKSFAKTCVGSPLYLSPEIINQERYSYATDAWSLGVMMYELAMLEQPFKGTNICQVAFKIVSAIPQPIDGLYSEELRRLVESLLDKDPQTRPTMDQVLFSPAVAPWAQHASVGHGLQWPPPDGPGTTASQSGLVQKLRSRMGRSACLEGGDVDTSLHDEYEDDFEAPEDPCDAEEEEADYDDDDFEVASGGSEASYEQDFEEVSDVDEPPELDEAALRQHLQAELGADGLAIAEGLGVVAFFEGMKISAQDLVSSC